MGLDAMIFVFWMLNFKPTFSLSSFTFIKRLFSSSSLSAIRVVTPNPSYDNPKCFQTLLNVPQGAKSPQIENQCAREKESLKKIGIHVSNNIFVVQLLSRVWLFATPWTVACQTSLPVRQHILEFAQTHFRWVRDAIQPSHPLSSRFPPAFSLSQHQDLFKWVSSSHQVRQLGGRCTFCSSKPQYYLYYSLDSPLLWGLSWAL